MNYKYRYNVVSRQHAGCMAWGERIIVHRSLPQGNVISKDRVISDGFSATESGEQDTRWWDVTHLFMKEPAVIHYRPSSLSNTMSTCLERPTLYRRQKEKWNKWLLNPRWQKTHSIDSNIDVNPERFCEEPKWDFKMWPVLWAGCDNFTETVLNRHKLLRAKIFKRIILISLQFLTVKFWSLKLSKWVSFLGKREHQPILPEYEFVSPLDFQ